MMFFVADRPLMTLQAHPVNAKGQTQGFLGLVLRLLMKKNQSREGNGRRVTAVGAAKDNSKKIAQVMRQQKKP
jgi:hypothetical protein